MQSIERGVESLLLRIEDYWLVVASLCFCSQPRMLGTHTTWKGSGATSRVSQARPMESQIGSRSHVVMAR